MGRRKKSSKKVIKKKKPGVATVFKCLYCGHEKCVECNLELGKGIGSLKCRVCGASFQMRINYLTEPVDVFCDCEAAISAARGNTDRASQEELVNALAVFGRIAQQNFRC